jgi:hypothetical protein
LPTSSTTDEDRARLERRFRNPPDLSAIGREAEAAVVRWVWTRRFSDRWSGEPLRSLRSGYTPARDFKREPKTRHGVERYGYDGAGRLRFAESFQSGEVDRRLIVQLDGGLSLRWQVDHLGSLEGLQATPADATRPASNRYIGSNGGELAQWFEYDDAGRLVSVRFEARGGDYDSWPRRRRGEERISYGPDGQPVRVVVHYDDPSAEPQTVYARIEETWDELADAVREPLVRAIAAAVSSCSEQLALVALWYPSADVAAPPPVVGACSAARRDQLIEEWGYDRLVLLPPEWRQDNLALDLPAEVTDACDKLRMLIDQDRSPRRGPHELMLSLASAVAAYPWPPSLSRTDDFAVYAIDAEGEDLERNVIASVPDRQVARWRELGMLDPAS